MAVTLLAMKKSKDSEQQEPMSLDLKEVPIPGWIDEDGDPVTSAVIVTGGIQVEKLPAKVLEYRTTLIGAWENCGRQLFDEAPYISWEMLRNYLLEEEGVTPETVRKMLNLNQKSRLVSELINAKIIEPRGVGWAVIDDFTFSYMMMRNLGK